MEKNRFKEVIAVTMLLSLYGCKAVSPPSFLPLDPQKIDIVNAKETSTDPFSPPTPRFYGQAPLTSAPKNRVAIIADYLLWKAGEEGLDYGVNATKTSSDSVVTTDGSSKEVSGKWSSGFRIGLGYNRGDNWDLSANWTYFHNHSQSSTTATNAELPTDAAALGEVVYPSWAPNLMGVALSGSSSWKLNYDVVDVAFGTQFAPTQAISCHLHAGLRGADIRQHIHNSYDSLNYSSDEPGAPFETTSTVKGHNNFLGLGLRAGTDLFWNFSDHWGIFGKVSAALVYGQFKVKETFNASPNNGSQELDPIVVKMHHNSHNLQPNLEATLGLRWKTSFRQGKQQLAIGVGYEVIEWFHQNQFFTLNSTTESATSPQTFSQSTRRGNLNLQGATVTFRYDF